MSDESEDWVWAFATAALPARVQKLYAPQGDSVFLELKNERGLLHCSFSAQGPLAPFHWWSAKPSFDGIAPSGLQHVARAALAGCTCSGVISQLNGHRFGVHFQKGTLSHWLWVQLGRDAALWLQGPQGRVLAAWRIRREMELRVGQSQELLGAPDLGRPTEALRDRALAFLVARAQSQSTAQSSKAAAKHPLKTKMEKLQRTIAKVEREAGRTPLAESHQAQADALKWWMSQPSAAPLPKSESLKVQRAVLPMGNELIEVQLKPGFSVAQNMAWHYARAKRMRRGSELARARAELLRAQLQKMAANLAAPEENESPAPSVQPLIRQPPKKHTAALPYRIYRALSGQLIWVGKGAASNEALTLHIARPFHLWMHVRGHPGAHVVVPLSKNASISQNDLIDAAHLALHHSDLKGAGGGEVSHTLQKHVRRPKGASPGQVTYTHEKTFWLRVDPERLKTLLTREEHGDGVGLS